MDPSTSFRENLRERETSRYGPQRNCNKIEQNVYVLKKYSGRMEKPWNQVAYFIKYMRLNRERIDSSHTGNFGA